jgi:hypothetical protein
MNPNELSWTIDDPNDMLMVIQYQGHPVMTISMAEAIESCSRNKVLNHVKECDRSPWLERWTNEKHTELIDILRS